MKSPEILHANETGDANTWVLTWKDVKEPFLNLQYCFQFDQITLEKVLLVLDQSCVCVSREPHYRNKPLVCR